MVVEIIVFLALFGMLAAYLYGVFTPVTVFKDKLLTPVVFYTPFRGTAKQLSSQFDKIASDASQVFKFSTCLGIYYSKPEEAIW
jgi:hypothetical protein